MLYVLSSTLSLRFFFFHDPATTEIYTLSLHDALPISLDETAPLIFDPADPRRTYDLSKALGENITLTRTRSEEHTSELQSRPHLVCRLLLEKKKNTTTHDLASTHHAYDAQR